MIFQRDNEEENNLNYQLKKIIHMIQLQIMDIQSTLHYVQKKHTLHQIKQVLSQIYNIFNETQVIFKHFKALFLHTAVKKLMNFFGVIYFMLTGNIENGKTPNKQVLFSENNKKNISALEQLTQKEKIKKEGNNTDSYQAQINHRPLGGVYLYNENYSRYLCSNTESKQKRTKNEQKSSLSKDEFKKQIMDQLNDNFLRSPHPDEMIDLFTFKFKYGREKQVVTFHDQLQSIAKFFKDSQNEAFQFLNKTKDQNATLTYNDSFSDIMKQIRLQKEIKLEQFTNKIKNAFKSIKSKTEDKWNQIQNKLVQVKQIKKNIKPPQTRDQNTQTSYNIDEEIKYLKKKIDTAQQKYKLMHQMKKREVEENTMVQIQMESQLSLKARQLVYLKIALEENKVMINNLNKRIKLLTDNHKKIKQTINLSVNSKQDGIKKLAELVEAEEVTSECASEQQKNSLQSLRKQKKMAKKLVTDARRHSSIAEKPQYAKRFTQQMQGPISNSRDILEKWGLSEISQQSDLQAFSVDQSAATNKNTELTRQNLRKNTKNMINVKQTQNIAKVDSSFHSIKSVKDQGMIRKQTVKKIKTNSQFLSPSRPSSFIINSTEQKQQKNEDSLFDQSESQAQSEANEENNQENIRRLQEMFKRQLKRSNNSILQRKKAMASQMNQRAVLKSKFSTDETQSKKSISNKTEHLTSLNHLQKKSAGISNATPKYTSSSIVLSTSFNQMHSIDQNQQAKDLHSQIKTLQTKNKQLQKILDKKNKVFLILCHKQIQLAIEPLKSTKVGEIRQFLKLKSEAEEQTQYTDLKTDKKSNLRNSKHKKTFYFKQNKTATQVLPRSVAENKIGSFKQSTESFYSQDEMNNQKSKRQYLSKTEINLFESLKKENKQQIGRIYDEKKDFYQKLKTLETQKASSSEKIGLQTKSIYLTGKQNKNNLLDVRHSIPQRISQNIEEEAQKKEEEEQQKKIRQLALNCRTKKQFKNQISQIHWQKCGRYCKHLQQYINNFNKYRNEVKSKLKMHVENLNSSMENQPQLPILNKKK